MPERADAAGFGLYIHWPFCLAKCPYCDFNSHVAGEIDEKRWVRDYVAEIERVAAETPGRVLNTVFFGGGTPSLMPGETVEAVLAAVRAAWPLANDLEVTLEANPTSAEAERFRAYRAAGVDRLSLGVQALNDADLRALGRQHDVAEAMAALALARDTFDRVSFDLIYARQNQTAADWRAELGRALALQPDHLSLYQLTIEEGTVFGRRAAADRLPGLPDEEVAAEMYFDTQAACEAAGLPAYEISNHARPGAESRHNLIYWRGGDWAGIGPGAHGRLTLAGRRWATETPLAPGDWLRRVETTGSGEARRVALTESEQAGEYLMMGLRLREGIALARYEALAGAPLNPNKINELAEDGLIATGDGRLWATARGRPLLNALLRALLPD